MIFMTPHKASNRRSKVDVSRIFAQHFPKLGPDLTDGTPYTTNLQVFLRPWVGSMNIIRIKNSRVNESHYNQKTPATARRGGCRPPFETPPLVRLVGEARRNLTKFLSSGLKVVPRPSEDFLVSFWTGEKPYKCIGSK